MSFIQQKNKFNSHFKKLKNEKTTTEKVLRLPAGMQVRVVAKVAMAITNNQQTL